MPETSKVLIVGSGKRIQQAFLPALELCADRFETIGIHSPHILDKKDLCQRWELTPYPALERAPFDETDLVVVSVPKRLKPAVLRQLPRGDYDLLMDTPAIGKPADGGRSAIPEWFRKVTVAEDFIRYPQFGLLLDAVNSGVIGRVQRVEMSRIGYSYHGLALLRMFFDRARVERLRRAPRLPGERLRLALELEGGGLGLFSYPYSRSEGFVEITGTGGTFLYRPDFSGDVERSVAPDGTTVFRLDRGAHHGEATMVPAAPHWKIDDPFLEYKIVGVERIFRELAEGSSESFYPYEEGVYDNHLSSLAPAARFVPTALLERRLPRRNK